MGGLSSALLLLIFLAGAGATWAAGMLLSKTTDALDARWGLGEDIGGLVFLSIAGSLPEVAITVSAAAQGHLGLAAGNLIGGIAIQTMVLLVCDFAAGPQRPLTYLVGRLTPVLEGLLVVILVAGVEMGSLLKPSTAIFGRINPASIAIVVIWSVGLYVINRTSKDPRWSVEMPGSKPGRHRHERRHPDQAPVRVVDDRPGRSRFRGRVGRDARRWRRPRGNWQRAREPHRRKRCDLRRDGARDGERAAGDLVGDRGRAARRSRARDGDVLGGNAFQVCLFLVANTAASVHSFSPVKSSAQADSTSELLRFL